MSLMFVIIIVIYETNINSLSTNRQHACAGQGLAGAAVYVCGQV